MNKRPANSRVPSIDRALSIMEMLVESKKGLSNSEISRLRKLPKSTTSYLLRTLEERGYVQRDQPSGRYRVTAKLFSVGSQALHGLELHDVAIPVLQDLVDKTGITGHLAILDGHEAVYIAKIDKPGIIKVNTWVGRRLDVHSTAVGKALVAHLPQETIEEIIKEKGLPKHTPRTITSPSQFLLELEKVRTTGYALCHSEHSLGVNCVAAPTFNIQGKVEAAVGLTGTESQMRLPKMKTCAKLVKQAARVISKQRGYHGLAHRGGLSGSLHSSLEGKT